MRVIIDTNVLLWWMTGSERLTPEWEDIMSAPSNTILVSSISVAEVGVKASIGKLPPTPEPIPEAMTVAGFEELPFTMAHGQALATLPWHHKDPFDRMIIVQALAEGLPVLTADRVFKQYGLQVISGRS